MAGTIHQLPSLGLMKSSEEKDWKRQHKHKKSLHKSYDSVWKEDPSQWWDNHNSKVHPPPTYPDFQHKTLRIDGWYNPSSVGGEELRSKGLSVSTQAPDIGPYKRSSFVAFSPSLDGELRTIKVIHDEGAAFVASLRVCTKNKDLYRGARLHDDILRRGLLEKCSDALVIMYAKCGALVKAKELLDMHKSRDICSWTALIAGYARQGQSQAALNCFEQMKHDGLSPDAVTFSCILKACGNLGAAEKGKQIHDEIARQGLLGKHIVLGTALVSMYAKCGALAKAQRVLEELPSRNVITWSALIAGYAQQGQGEQALNCFERMQHEGIPPNAVTFACILKACGTLRAAEKGKQIHDEISRQGLLENNIVLGNALVDMYAKCGALAQAQRVLGKLPSRNVITWNVLIAGYAQEGQGEQALNCFKCMQGEGFSPDAVTYACILKACGSLGATDKGEKIHDEIAKQGLLLNDDVLGTALVDMYVKCGALTKAQQVHEELPSRNVISWSALIAGYAHQGQGEEALSCFKCMQREGIPPNAVTFACILKACGTLGAADKGEQIHDEITRQGLLRNNVVLGNALVDMYAKCGALAKAQQVLEELPSRDVVSWNSLITGYTQQGQGEQAISCFEHMQQEGIPPDVVTFSCVLNVCSHLGLVEDGHMHFVNMSTKYGVKPNLELYTCMIDLFGRAGHLEKAVGVIQEMPSSDYSAVWHALLAACLKWRDVIVGRWAFEQAVQLDKSDGAAYVLMANIYAAAGMEENAKDIEAMRLENEAWKKPGRSLWIDMSGIVHAFSVGDTKHAQRKYIYAKLEEISRKMSQEGISPGVHGVSLKISDAAKKHLLCRHSENLAIACALINTPQGEGIRIVKNMQMCGDCHVATSLISNIEKRKIVVKDANFRHDFKDGKCSCGDYFL